MNTAFPISSPEEQGVSSSAIWTMLDEIESQHLEITSMMLLVNGKLILRFCKKPYDPSCRQLWFSTTKAFTGIGVGIACDQGYISVNDFVISFFPDKLPQTVSENLSKMRIRHLLSMTCGIHENTYSQIYPQKDWIKAFLAQDFPHEPGTYYRYSTHASHMLAAIVERVTGMNFFDFAKTNLMLPLGVDDMTWEICEQGITTGGMGLGLTPEAVARFGYMLLNHGVYNGKRIVSEEYLALALTEQSNNQGIEKNRHKNGYGFHMCIDYDGSFFHEGSFGQLCYVSPRKAVVFVVTSRKNNCYEVIDLFHSLFSTKNHLANHIDKALLQQRLATMAYPTPKSIAIPANTPHINGLRYSIDANELGLESVIFQLTDVSHLNVCLEYADRKPSRLCFDFTAPSSGDDYFVKDIQIHLQRYISYASWLDNNTVNLTVLYIETPYVITYLICFLGDTISLNYNINVTFGIRECHVKGKVISGSLHS